MRPDLIRLLVDTRRKELVTEADPNGGIATYSTRERLGLNNPIDIVKEDKGKGGATATKFDTLATSTSS